MDTAQKKEAVHYLKRRFPWLKASQILRIVTYGSIRGSFNHWQGDLSTLGLPVLQRLALESRLRAEGLSVKNVSRSRIRTDRVLMDHRKSTDIDYDLLAKRLGLPEPDDTGSR